MASMVHGKERHVTRVAQIADILDERAVAIEEHGRASKHLPRRADHAVDADAAHAAMIERALAQHARPAPDRVREHRRARRPTGRVGRSSVGPNTAVTRTPSAAAEVHRAGVVRHERAARGEDAGERRQVGLPMRLRTPSAAERSLDRARRRRSAAPADHAPANAVARPARAASSANDAGGQRLAPP